MASLIFWYILLGLTSKVLSMDPCTWLILSCSQHKQDFMRDGQLFEDADELQRVCKESLRYRNCINGALKQCNAKGILKYMPEQLFEARLLTQSVCDTNSKWHQAYQESAVCINEYQPELADYCETRKSYTEEEMSQPNYDAQLCSDLSRLLLCQSNYIERNCGDTAGELYKRLVVYKDELDFFCRKFITEEKPKKVGKKIDTESSITQFLRTLLNFIPFYEVEDHVNTGPDSLNTEKVTKKQPAKKVFIVKLDNVFLNYMLKTKHLARERMVQSPFMTIQLNPKPNENQQTRYSRSERESSTEYTGFVFPPRKTKARPPLSQAYNPANLFTIRVEDERHGGNPRYMTEKHIPETFKVIHQESFKNEEKPNIFTKNQEEKIQPADLGTQKIDELSTDDSRKPIDKTALKFLENWVQKNKAETTSDKCKSDTTAKEIINAWTQSKRHFDNSDKQHLSHVKMDTTRNRLKTLFLIPTDHSTGKDIIKHWTTPNFRQTNSISRNLPYVSGGPGERVFSDEAAEDAIFSMETEIPNEEVIADDISFGKATSSGSAEEYEVRGDDRKSRFSESNNSKNIKQTAECSTESMTFQNRTKFILHQLTEGHALYLGCGSATFDWKQPEVMLNNIFCSWISPKVSSELFNCEILLDVDCRPGSFKELGRRLQLKLFGLQNYMDFLLLDHIGTAYFESFQPASQESISTIPFNIFADFERVLDDAEFPDDIHRRGEILTDDEVTESLEPTIVKPLRTNEYESMSEMSYDVEDNERNKIERSSVSSQSSDDESATTRNMILRDELALSQSRDLYQPNSLFRPRIGENFIMKQVKEEDFNRLNEEDLTNTATTEHEDLNYARNKPKNLYADKKPCSHKMKSTWSQSDCDANANKRPYILEDCTAIGETRPNYVILSKPYSPNKKFKHSEHDIGLKHQRQSKKAMEDLDAHSKTKRHFPKSVVYDPNIEKAKNLVYTVERYLVRQMVNVLALMHEFSTKSSVEIENRKAIEQVLMKYGYM